MRKIKSLFLVLLILCPLMVFAEEEKVNLSKYNTLNLTEVLGDEEIKPEYKEYSEGKDKINMTNMRNALRKFQKHNLVWILDKELNHDDSRIIVYDSIAMAIRVEDIMKVTEIIHGYKKEGGNIDEETIESEID